MTKGEEHPTTWKGKPINKTFGTIYINSEDKTAFVKTENGEAEILPIPSKDIDKIIKANRDNK